MRQQLAPTGNLIARIAARQHGVISAAQLAHCGLSASAIKRRAVAGELHRIHRGIYAVGHPSLSANGTYLAAVLACGQGAVLSHRSAAELWGLLARRRGPVDVTIPTRTGRSRRPGIRIHRPNAFDPADTTIHTRIPVTTVLRTLDDLRRVVSSAELRDAIRAAEIAGKPVGDLGELTRGTYSELELRFLAMCNRHRIPEPEVNAAVGRYRVDFLWRAERLIAETDGERFHRGALARAADAARQRELERLGFEVLRFADADEPRVVARELRRGLAARRSLLAP